jgi:NAD(P)-dependent dehydrogenase (short-subunit alcohol dehydrogenase family)
MKKQRVLVTAGAGGIGRVIIEAFAATGAQVFTCDINADGLAALELAVPGVRSIVCDISSRAAIERMVAAAVASLGGLDVLVNNAGISGPTAPADELSPDDWEKVVQVNLTGTFNVTRLAIPHRARASGKSLDEVTREALATQSLKHLVDPRHIADLAVFLASDSGRAISGQMLPIDCDMQRT